MDDWIEELKRRGIACLPNALGASLTTFGSGGAVKCVIFPKDEKELLRALRLLSGEGVPYRVLGGGSNVLLSDRGFDGAILRLSALSSWERKGRDLWVGAGVKTAFLSKKAVEQGLSGLEFACGIPGEIGGAVKQNAGAFGQMISDTLEQVTVIGERGEIDRLKAADLGFGYHCSRLPQGAIVLSARFRLSLGDRTEMEKTMRTMREKRSRTQPHAPSAGSVFRKAGETPAALLIERTGLKGTRVGNAELSPMHCNFIVNRGGATTEQYFALGERIKEKVRALCGISLEYEVERICSPKEL